jgi:hypothetical protein
VIDDAYTRAFRRAIDKLGSSERLAKALGASVAEIEAWALGAGVPPPGAFLGAIEIGAHGRDSPDTRSEILT